MVTIRLSLIFLAISLLAIAPSSHGAISSRFSSDPLEGNGLEEAVEADQHEESVGEEGEEAQRKYEESMIDFGQQLGELPLGIPDEEKNVPGEPLTPQDFINAKSMELLVPIMDENTPDPIQSAGLFEGDIAGINGSSGVPFGRNAIRDMNMRWPDGVIPYVISSAFDSRERGVIAAAFDDYQKMSCIRFVPRTDQQDYIYLMKGSGCSSLVGRNGQKQQVSLGAGCVYKGIIIHELMHAAGFWHEQSRPDRDDYVTILWDNIIPDMKFNFNKYDWNTVQALGVAYDTGSVMHYTKNSFSKDGRSPTILPKHGDADFLGQRKGFSDKDLSKLNKLYECGNTETTSMRPPITGGRQTCVDNHQFCGYWSRQGECSRNPNWMLVNCKKSCNQCGKKCENYNKNCNYWAQIGECTNNPSYMTIYCAQACNTCNSVTKETSTCTDNNQYCRAWAEDNQCLVNPNYMLFYCRRSCGQC